MGQESVLAGRSKLSSGRPSFSSRMEESSHELCAPRALMSSVAVCRFFSTDQHPLSYLCRLVDRDGGFPQIARPRDGARTHSVLARSAAASMDMELLLPLAHISPSPLRA